MGITVVGHAYATDIDNYAAGASGNDTITWPEGILETDYVVGGIYSNGGSSSVSALTLLESSLDTSWAMRLYSGFYSASIHVVEAAWDTMRWRFVVLRGVDPSTPIGVHGMSTNGVPNTVFPTIEVTVNNSYVVRQIGKRAEWSFTFPGTWTRSPSDDSSTHYGLGYTVESIGTVASQSVNISGDRYGGGIYVVVNPYQNLMPTGPFPTARPDLP